MGQSDFQQWARRYRIEAATDDYRIAIQRWDDGFICFHGEGEPIQKWRAREAVRDTIRLVALVLSYYRTDGRSGAERFLSLQTYDPDLSEGRYLLVFDAGQYRRTLLIVDELSDIDLADLYLATYFRGLSIVPLKGTAVDAELARLQQSVLEDVRYDIPEAELALEFHESTHGLQVCFDEPCTHRER